MAKLIEHYIIHWNVLHNQLVESTFKSRFVWNLNFFNLCVCFFLIYIKTGNIFPVQLIGKLFGLANTHSGCEVSISNCIHSWILWAGYSFLILDLINLGVNDVVCRGYRVYDIDCLLDGVSIENSIYLK